ncbi:hypothetical protein Bbelb_312820 [Branchiostoma belcheri]|nr:hypothetical protein Bbelb_312820 [Branchiostoma belcheri]
MAVENTPVEKLTGKTPPVETWPVEMRAGKMPPVEKQTEKMPTFEALHTAIQDYREPDLDSRAALPSWRWPSLGRAVLSSVLRWTHYVPANRWTVASKLAIFSRIACNQQYI